MSTMLLESALAELSTSQPNAADGNHDRPHQDGRSYADRRLSAEMDPRKPAVFSSMMQDQNPCSHGFPPILPNADATTPYSAHPDAVYCQLSAEMDRQPPDRSPPISISPRHSPEMDRRKSSLSPPISAGRRPFEEEPSAEIASNPHSTSRNDGMTRRLSTYEKQISIDPHSISYRALDSTPFVRESELPGRRNPSETSALSSSHLTPLQPPPALPRLISTSDASTAPHSPRSINFPGKMRSYLRGRLSVPDLTQVSPSVETLNSDYSSDRSSDYSVAESPISTLDLHRSPLNIAPPSPPSEYYYNTIYVPPPPPPPPRYSTLSAGVGGAARSLFSAPLPQPQRMGSYKKTISFQVREVDDFTYGRQERYKVTASDIVERPASLRRGASLQLDRHMQSSRGASMERHASSRLDAYVQSSRGASMERPASSGLDAYMQSSRGASMERRNHSLREIIENPRSSSAEISCCSFIPFLGGPKARLNKQPSQIQISSPVTSQRVYDSVYGNATPTSNGLLKQSVNNEQTSNMSLNNESPEAIFREPSVMERFEYRNSASTGELYIEGEEEDDLDDEDEEPNKIERAEEVLLSFNEAYSPVASAFVFHPSEGSTTTRNNVGGGEVTIVPRKALKGSNGAGAATAGTRPAFRRVRFNLESAETVAVEQEAESEMSSLASNSREMPTMMASTMGPSSLPRSTTRRAWDELLNTANNEGHHKDGDANYGNPEYHTRAESSREHQADLLLRLVNGAKSSKEATSYKPMLFCPDTN